MKPNGRRRWRKRAAGQRYKQRKLGCDWDFWKQNRHYALACRHMAKRMGDKPLPSAPAKKFSARSLVGMTMGARKRAWLALTLNPVVFPSGIGTDRDEMLSAYSWPEIRRDWPLLGQRLRPCPGCKDCGYEASVKMWCLRRGRWCAGSLRVKDIKHICDGSGVMPARKAAK